MIAVLAHSLISPCYVVTTGRHNISLFNCYIIVRFCCDYSLFIHMFVFRNCVRISKNFSRDRRECPSSFIFYKCMRS